MSDIELKQETLEDVDLELLKVIGTLDVATIPRLEESLGGLRQAEKSRVIIDLEGLEYISSSGLGAFLGLVDGFRDSGGDLVFVNLSSRVMKIFTVVGFTRILTILKDMDAALAHFNSGNAAGDVVAFRIKLPNAPPHSGEAFDLEVSAVDDQGRVVNGFDQEVDLRPSTGIVSPAKTAPFVKGKWEGCIILTGPGTVSLQLERGDLSGAAAVMLREDKPPVALPVEVRCPRCGVSTQIAQFNVYRCKQCNEIYFVDRWAHAISLRSPDTRREIPVRVLTVKIPADVNLLGPLRIFLTSALKEGGFPKDFIHDVELCVDEAATNVVEHAYEYDISGQLQVTLTMKKEKIILEIRDQGRPFDPQSLPKMDLEKHIQERKTGGLGYYLMNTFMDKVDYQYMGSSNVLTLEKSVSAEDKKEGEEA